MKQLNLDSIKMNLSWFSWFLFPIPFFLFPRERSDLVSFYVSF